jgi:glycosyltransferase involved in cell wall biosynthesis/2-polyprenyl-3-methyl-5-hydroxy-6-metoxy-1,4-benzoquinol methylase
MDRNLMIRPTVKNFPKQDLSILFIVPSDYASLLKKGVATMILERDERGFFKKVFNVHPYASKTQTLDLNGIHQLTEFGPDYPFSILNFKGGGIINYLLKPIPIIKALADLVKRKHINVIRATDPYWCGFYAWAVSKLTGIPFCISIHADYDKFYSQIGGKRGTSLLFRMFERFVLPRTPLVMPIREHLVSDMVKKGADSKKIRVIPHGIGIEEFLCADLEDIQNISRICLGKKVLSFVGRLGKDNYVDDIIELAKRLSKIRDDFIVVFVGDGPEGVRLKTLVKEYNLTSVVMFAGFQPKEMVISIQRHSFIALCLKGGFSLIEACAAGCPPISYNIEWHYELVKNKETGFLISEGDLNALIEAVIYLLDHPVEARAMGERARKLAISRHDISQTSEIKKQCYRELMEMGKGLGRVRSEDMKQKQKGPVLEIIKNNPWYTIKQLPASEGHQKRTVQHRYDFILQNIEDYLNSNSGKSVRILDAGCGDGVQLQILTQIPEMEIWGADYNPLRASRAKRNFPTAHIVCGDLLDLPFSSASFDIILCSQVIEHIPQDDLLLKNLAHTLKPKGLLILGTPNEGCLMARLRNHLLERGILKSTDHLQFYTEISIRHKIEAAGFIIQQVLRENWFFPHQRINFYLTNRKWGFRFMAQLNKIIPSQAAGYYFKCVRC